MRRAALIVALAACDNTAIVRPVIDHPTGALDPFDGLDGIQLSIAVAGDPNDLDTASFRRGETIELPGVDYGVNLVIHMLGTKGSDEVAYGRTCPFSIQPGGAPPTPHLYFAPNVTWAEAQRPPSAMRSGGTAIRYRDSGIFVGGTDNAAAPVVGIDRFDALRGTFEKVAELEPRRFGNAAILGDGRVVIGGGVDLETRPIALLEVVTIPESDAPAAPQVKSVDAGPLVGVNSSAFTTLSSGQIISFGGRDAGNIPIRDLVEISPKNGGVTLRVLNNAKLATARFGHTATALSEDPGAPVLIAGGLNAALNVVDTAELYKPLQEELASPTEFAPKMVVPRSGHQAVRLPDGSILIVGGLDQNKNPVRELEQFSLDRGFHAVGTLPPTAGITDFTATPLPDGRVLLAGGRDGSNNPVNTAFIARLDQMGGDIQILTTDLLATARYGHQATLLCDGTVMLTGGTLAEAPAERYNPPKDGRR